jgi:hypothetical protein
MPAASPSSTSSAASVDRRVQQLVVVDLERGVYDRPVEFAGVVKRLPKAGDQVRAGHRSSIQRRRWGVPPRYVATPAHPRPRVRKAIL